MVHNASIMNAVGATGLQLYRFGEAVSIVFFTGAASQGPVGPAVARFAGDASCGRSLAPARTNPGQGHRSLYLPIISHFPDQPDNLTPPLRTPLCSGADTWRPDSFYDRIAANRKAGLHTLCLLDIKVRPCPPPAPSLHSSSQLGVRVQPMQSCAR